MSQIAHNNLFFDRVSADFVKAVNRKGEMERNFRSSMMDEYTSVLKEVVSSAVDLAKAGVKRWVDGDDVVFVVEDQSYVVEAAEIRKVIGDDQFNVLFPPMDAEPDADGSAMSDDGKADGMSSFQQFVQMMGMDPNNALVNPQMFNIMDQDWMPFMMMYLMSNKKNHERPRVQPEPRPEEKREPEKAEDLISEVSGFQKKILMLDREKEQAKEQAEKAQADVGRLKEELSQVRMESSQEVKLREQLDSDYQKAQERIRVLDEGYKRLMEAKKYAENEVESLRKELDELKQSSQKEIAAAKEDADRRVSDARKSAEESYRSKSQSEHDKSETQISRYREDSERAAAALKNANSQIETLKAQLANAERKAASDTEKIKNDADAAARTAADEKGRLEKRISELEKLKESADKKAVDAGDKQKELQKLRSSNDRLSNEVDKLKKDLEAEKKNAEKYSVAAKGIPELEELAYKDKKTQTYNTNAFNRDFSLTDKDNAILAMLSICGTKAINNQYGMETGDRFIGAVAKAVQETFPSGKVYRIMGDQFTVLLNKSQITAEQTSNSLYQLQSALRRDSIMVVFGMAVGMECADITQMVRQAEAGMLQMKMGGTMQQPMMQQGQAQPQQQIQQAQQVAPTPQQNTQPMPAQQQVPTPQPVQPRPVAVESSKQAPPQADGGAEEVDLDEQLMSFMTG